MSLISSLTVYLYKIWQPSPFKISTSPKSFWCYLHKDKELKRGKKNKQKTHTPAYEEKLGLQKSWMLLEIDAILVEVLKKKKKYYSIHWALCRAQKKKSKKVLLQKS